MVNIFIVSNPFWQVFKMLNAIENEIEIEIPMLCLQQI